MVFLKIKRNKMKTPQINDKINFKIATRYGWVRGPRIVREVFPESHYVTVRCAGFSDFVVHFHEITELTHRKVKCNH